MSAIISATETAVDDPLDEPLHIPSGDINTRVIEILALLEELANQVKHLVRSQGELNEALQESPADEDFKAAIDENAALIRRKQAIITDMYDELRKMDQSVLKGDVAHRLAVLGINRPPALVARDSAIATAPNNNNSAIQNVCCISTFSIILMTNPLIHYAHAFIFAIP